MDRHSYSGGNSQNRMKPLCCKHESHLHGPAGLKVSSSPKRGISDDPARIDVRLVPASDLDKQALSAAGNLHIFLLHLVAPPMDPPPAASRAGVETAGSLVCSICRKAEALAEAGATCGCRACGAQNGRTRVSSRPCQPRRPAPGIADRSAV